MFFNKVSFGLILIFIWGTVCFLVFAITDIADVSSLMGNVFAISIAVSVAWLSWLFDESATWKRKEAELESEMCFGRLVRIHGSHTQALSFLSALLVKDFANQGELQQIGMRSSSKDAELQKLTLLIRERKALHRTYVRIAEGHGYVLPKDWTYNSLILPEHRTADTNVKEIAPTAT